MEPALDYFYRPTLENAEALLRASHVSLSLPRHSSHARSMHGGDARPYKMQVLPTLDFLHDVNREELLLPASMVDLLLTRAGCTEHHKAAMIAAYKDRRVNYTRHVADWLGMPKNAEKEQFQLPTLATDVVEMVLDGVVDEVEIPLPPEKEWPFQRALCLHAFIMQLLGRSGENPSSPKVGEVRFLYGVFQSMDVSGWEGFLRRWVRSMRAVCSAYASQVTLQKIDASHIAPYDDRIQKVGRHHVRVQHADVPIRRASMGAYDLTNPSATWKSLVDGFGVTYPKSYLVRVWTVALLLLERFPARKEEVVSFLERLVLVNWLRDVYKADVALRRGAIYVTFDRLAYTYYVLRGGMEGLPHQGMLV